MRKRFWKRGAATLMAMMLAVPGQPVFADVSMDALTQEGAVQEESSEEAAAPDDKVEENSGKDVDESAEEEESKEEKNSEAEEETETEKETEAEEETEAEKTGQEETDTEEITKAEPEIEAEEEITGAVLNSFAQELRKATPVNAEEVEYVAFNTGSYQVKVVSEEAFLEQEVGDAYFEEDGSYTINIPEDNPFFPYEVQFTYDGKTENKWFMDPDDSVKVDGHTFYVSAYFDGTVMTQMSVEVAGQEVIAYPEEKEFTDGDDVMELSLLPLEERSITLNLEGFTPAELSRVKLGTLLAGETELDTATGVLWKLRDRSDDNYRHYDTEEQIEEETGTRLSKDWLIDLALDTANNSSVAWEIILGEFDQLASSNIRYYVTTEVTPSRDWIVPTLTVVNEDGSQREVKIEESSYRDSSYSRRLDIKVDPNEEAREFLLTLDVNEKYGSKNIIFNAYNSSTSIVDYECSIGRSIYVDLAAYDDAGNLLGGYLLRVLILKNNSYVNLNMRNTDGSHLPYTQDYGEDPYVSWDEEIFRLNNGYAADQIYSLTMSLENAKEGEEITAAYLGIWETKEDAEKNGATNIKTALFDDDKGYQADFSKGVYISVFRNSGDDPEQYKIITVEKSLDLSDGTYVSFSGLRDASGQWIDCQVLNPNSDTYADDYAGCSYYTFLVNKDVDLTAVAPVFSTEEGITLYSNDGNGSAEVSGVSKHDFSKGAVQYTASSESGRAAKNIWLQIVKPQDGAGKLYINSLVDPDAETYVKDGVVYSTREVLLDGRYDYEHHILLANLGTEAIPKLSVETSGELFQYEETGMDDDYNLDGVYLDKYWTLKGKHDLPGFSSIKSDEITNLAKLMIWTDSENELNGAERTGTLTFKSDGKTIMVMTLKATVGDPGIVTEEIPNAVKYVHYGTMIQNSNKYDFNTVSYSIVGGKLPAGMEMKKNGELYGVPTETGEFTVTVRMKNSYESFESCEKTFTFTVEDNTDANVDSTVDKGYELKERVPNIGLYDSNDYTMTSIGVFDEWENLYLDGKKLTEGVDFDAKSGSTRLTIRSQTLKSGNQVGTHTLSAEFRVKEDGTLRRAAQNYQVSTNGTTNNSSSDSHSSSESGHDSSSSASKITWDAKKGYTSREKGIITGETDKHSKWEKTEKGWKLNYADKTTAAGSNVKKEDGSAVMQILWEKINGSWYAFNADGYLATGWVYDYNLNGWYYVSENSGMVSGWRNETQDGFTYYLNTDGSLVHGWKQIDGKWYYFNELATGVTWIYDAEKNAWAYNTASGRRPWGALYLDALTPDGYRVGKDGVWDGQKKAN